MKAFLHFSLEGHVIQMSEPEQKPGGSSVPGLSHILRPDLPMNSVSMHPALSAPAPQVPHVQSCWWLYLPS